MEYQYRPRETEQSFDQSQFSNQTQSENIASERLRKAIERNRQRQAMRETSAGPESQTQARSQTQSRTQAPPFRPAPQQQTQTQRPNEQTTNTQFRQGFSRVEDIGFAAEFKRERKIPGNNVDYMPSRGQRELVVAKPMQAKSSRISREEKNRYIKWAVTGSWIFIGLLFFRLIFANRGVVEYYSLYNTLKDKENSLSDVEQENLHAIKEIEKIRSDTGYQKRMIRDNLGYIAEDEFMVLFAKR